jgi:hypothetical protein
LYPDIGFKIFNDLDLTLFSGMLRHKACLRSKATSTGYLGQTEPAGQAAARVAIKLNVARMHSTRADPRTCLPPYRELIKTLVHEMIHAFIYVECGGRPEGRGTLKGVEDAPWKIPPREDDNEHGPAFRLVMAEVDHRLRRLEGAWATLDLGEKGRYMGRPDRRRRS